jgi:PAS domain S-box-containing protein
LLKNKEAEYSSLIENMGGVLYRCDIQGYFTWLSKKCFALTGYTEAELKSKHFTELIVPEWRHQVEEFYFNQNSYRIPETVFRFPIYSKDGYKKWVEQTVVFVYEGPRCLGYQAIVKDVTDTKLGEDLLQEGNKQSNNTHNNFQIPRYFQSANFTEHRKIK